MKGSRGIPIARHAICRFPGLVCDAKGGALIYLFIYFCIRGKIAARKARAVLQRVPSPAGCVCTHGRLLPGLSTDTCSRPPPTYEMAITGNKRGKSLPRASTPEGCDKNSHQLLPRLQPQLCSLTADLSPCSVLKAFGLGCGCSASTARNASIPALFLWRILSLILM